MDALGRMGRECAARWMGLGRVGGGWRVMGARRLDAATDRADATRTCGCPAGMVQASTHCLVLPGRVAWRHDAAMMLLSGMSGLACRWGGCAATTGLFPHGPRSPRQGPGSGRKRLATRECTNGPRRGEGAGWPAHGSRYMARVYMARV